MTEFELGDIDFDKGGGLVPAIVQDHRTLQVLTLAYMDRSALAETIESGEATFYSRARGGRWRKGETSGHRLKIVALTRDCDSDALLLSVEPLGPACHLGSTACFGKASAPGLGRLGAMERTIEARAANPSVQSWTSALLASGVKRIAQKLGEEGVECALAGAAGDTDELMNEAADLLYHLAVLLHARGASLDGVMKVLAARTKEEAS